MFQGIMVLVFIKATKKKKILEPLLITHFQGARDGGKNKKSVRGWFCLCPFLGDDTKLKFIRRPSPIEFLLLRYQRSREEPSLSISLSLVSLLLLSRQQVIDPQSHLSILESGYSELDLRGVLEKRFFFFFFPTHTGWNETLILPDLSISSPDLEESGMFNS